MRPFYKQSEIIFLGAGLRDFFISFEVITSLKSFVFNHKIKKLMFCVCVFLKKFKITQE